MIKGKGERDKEGQREEIMKTDDWEVNGRRKFEWAKVLRGGSGDGRGRAMGRERNERKEE